MDNAVKVLTKLQREWSLFRMSRDSNRAVRAVAYGIRSTLINSVSSEETEWINRIERLRAEMNASTEPIVLRDYGAGQPGSNRTQEEMRDGVAVTGELGRISQIAAKPAMWCLLLLRLVRTMRPNSCIEMGTSVGLSAAYQAAALKLNGHGHLSTLEGANPLAEIARKNLRQLGLETVDVVVGRFQDSLSEILERGRPVDYVFIDGHHDEQATLGYFEQILPSLASTALLVFDDIRWSDGMFSAWSHISGDPRVAATVDLGPVGLCLIDGSMKGHKHFSLPLP